MLVLVASLGWGVTRPYLDQPTILKAWDWLLETRVAVENGVEPSFGTQTCHINHIITYPYLSISDSENCFETLIPGPGFVMLLHCPGLCAGVSFVFQVPLLAVENNAVQKTGVLSRHSHSLSIAFVLLCLLPVRTSQSRFPHWRRII